ncbi:MAG: hypothetical protein H7Y31_04890 [Chitinophagaceae bacterium]|nr:hypothetical protein [Chitinophagaceae bacterium]
MKCILSLIVMTASTCSLFAQPDANWKEPVKESREYHEYRMIETKPPYGLKKLETIIAGLELKDDTQSDGIAAPTSKVYNALTLREKFTYHMIHAESYSQICDVLPPEQDEHKKIYASLADNMSEYAWSERQLKWFKANKDSVTKLIQECTIKSKRLGLNFKKVIVEINGRQMIPFLISTYNAGKKDGDILTVLLLLMKENNYPPLVQSASYKKLYSDDSQYNSSITYNKANVDLIIKRATDFYSESNK